MADHLAVNRRLWDRYAELHATSAWYDVEGFLAGRSSLKSIEREEMGCVRGRSLLHLQCHFGLDTLSWAREGALVTGVDFSTVAVGLARSLAAEANLEATFICADILSLPAEPAMRYDIVFTSYGVISWLADLDRWATVIAAYLKPSGIFYMVEFHPLVFAMDDHGERFAYPYCATGEALEFRQDGSYASKAEPLMSREWPHDLGEVVSALTRSGLRIDFLHEFPYGTYPYPPYLVEEAPDRYVWPDLRLAIPVLFSLKATAC